MTTDADFAQRVQQAIDALAKPVGALGRIEALAAQIARLQGRLRPRMAACRLILFVADHGLAAEGVSAYPQAVTRQMAQSFLSGGAAAAVFARQLGVDLAVVDAGIAGAPIAAPGLIDRRLGAGTANSLHGPAMTPASCAAALEAGAALAAAGDWDCIAPGEMGIGNTAAAALVAHKITGLDLALLTGRGTGLDDAGLAHKRRVLARAAARRPGVLAPREALSEYGGFEIAMMAGAMIGAAGAGRLVLVDGFIATVAALAAREIAPQIARALVFAHRSAEAGHPLLLDHLGARPLLDLEMRLGEGTGALLAWPLVRAAASMLAEMARLADLGVAGPR